MNSFGQDMLVKRAYDLLNAGRAMEAWTTIAPLRRQLENDQQGLGVYALAAQSLGRVDEAVEALTRLYALLGSQSSILGAIADTYGKAGRHAEAYDYWTRLVDREPDAREAHLNRAISASEAGLGAEALKAVDNALGRFSNDPRLIAIKAMILKNLERTEESIVWFEKAVAADPERGLTRYNQAVALRAAYRCDEACDAFEQARRLGLKGAEFHSNFAAAALEAMKVDLAETLYRQALDEDPTHDEARRGLTRLILEYRSGDGAFDHYRAFAERNTALPAAYMAWAKALINNRRYAEAVDVADRGVAANPSAAELRAVRAYAGGLVGDASKALAELEQIFAGAPLEQQTLMVQVAFRAGQFDRAARILERKVAVDPTDQTSWSMLGLAWRLLDDPREHWLCDYDRLVMTAEVVPVDGHAGARAYADEVAAMLDPLHVAMHEPGDQSLRGGTQTSGKLFARPHRAIGEFRQAIERAAAEQIARLPDDPAHPFLSRKSTAFTFSGSWSVRLSPEGHHVSHVHPEGWMSSAYYARLPADTADEGKGHDGWIQFGKPPEHFGIDLPPRRVVQPVPGRLVLFPSYLWHGTIPFQSGDRLTAAFDYLPA